MLAQLRPQVVLILTPNHLHHPMTMNALEAGAGVICEKPLALNASEAEEMLAVAREKGRRHLTFYTYRGLGGTRWVKQLISSGYVGRLHHVSASYLHGSWLDSDRESSWKTDRARSGYGVLADLGSHLIDLLHWWFGEIVQVAAGLEIFIPSRPGSDGSEVQVTTDDSAEILAQFQGGGQAMIQVSRVAPVRHNFMRIEMYGDQGSLVFEYEDDLAYVGRVSGARVGDESFHPLPVPDSLVKDLEGADRFPAVHASVTEGFFRDHNTGPTFADGVRAQRVIDAAARSATSRRWVTVS
jgi:predicted dehydrogenase